MKNQELNLALKNTFVPPRDRVELQLLQIWQDFFHPYPMGVKDNLFELGEDQFSVQNFINKIQQQFVPNLPVTFLSQNVTIEQLAQIIRKFKNFSDEESLIIPLQPRGSKRPFFLIPGGDGNVFNFHQLARHLGNEQPIYGFAARGLDGKQAPYNQVEEMVVDYLQALQTIQPQGPYLLGGHCFGSFVAFEMATQLQKQGQEVTLLVMLDSLDPILFEQVLTDNGWHNETQILTLLIYGFEFWFNKKLSIRNKDLQALELDEKFKYIMEQAKKFDIFPPDTKPEKLGHIFQIFKTIGQINYRPQTIYSGRMVVFRAKEFQFCENPTMGWDKWSSPFIETYDISGNHITMLTEPHVLGLAQQLKICFEQA